MGNAASIVGSEEEYHQRGNLPRAPHNIPYSELEKICATGIFLNSKVPSAKSQYKELVEVSIQKGKLDHLEILVLAGNIKEIDPLHIAAKYGNLESLELLNSAGFNAELSDKQGRVPMHLCAMNRSPDSVLCAHYLAVIAPKVLNYRDKKGDTPLLTALKRNNVEIFKALLSAGARLDLSDESGMSCRRLASELQHIEILKAIETQNALTSPSSSSRGAHNKNGRNAYDHNSSSNSSSKYTHTHKGDSKKSMHQEEINSERIMQVWEKFFENAFSAMGIEMDAEDNLMLGDVNSAATAAMKSSSIPSVSISPRLLQQIQSSYSSPHVHNSVPSASLPPLSQSKQEIAISEWFSWILCYTNIDDIGYYCLQPTTGTAVSMGEFHAIQEEYMLYSSNANNCRTMYSPLTSIASMVMSGWLPFYDETVNTSFLMHLSSGHCETYVHIERVVVKLPPPLVAYEHDPSYISADQSITYAWIIAYQAPRMPSPRTLKWDPHIEAEQGYYYMNTLSGHTSWTEPVGWNEIIESHGGWALCCDLVMNAYYWWDSVSGDTQWCE